MNTRKHLSVLPGSQITLCWVTLPMKKKVDFLITEVQELKGKLNIPSSIKDAGVSEAASLVKVDELAERAFNL
jgi:alcohol dehydrogenase class IV